MALRVVCKSGGVRDTTFAAGGAVLIGVKSRRLVTAVGTAVAHYALKTRRLEVFEATDALQVHVFDVLVF
jgi:hypothetical protein